MKQRYIKKKTRNYFTKNFQKTAIFRISQSFLHHRVKDWDVEDYNYYKKFSKREILDTCDGVSEKERR